MARPLRKQLRKHHNGDRPGGEAYCTLTDLLCPYIKFSVPESQIDHAIVDFDGCSVIVEYGRNVLSWEFVLSIAGLSCSYLIRRQVFPTLPSPTTTSLIGMGSCDM